VTLDDIAGLRLANQQLVTPTMADPAAVARRLGAVQAQDYAGAKWALGLRAIGLTDAAVERAFAEGSIIRTHVLRPTWHFVAPEDARWMLALTAPRIKAAMGYYDRQLGIDDAVVRRSTDAMTRALRGGKQLTRTELAEVLRRARVDVTGSQRLGHLMMRAELDGVVCSGARRGKQFTYALLDERVPSAPALERDEALIELTRRYFATRSPATAADFAWWSGLTVADATKGMRMAATELTRVAVGGETYWTSGPRPPSRRARAKTLSAHLLPNYDEYFIGFKDRSAIGQRLRSSALVTGGNALIGNVIVVDGQLVGAWRRAVETDAVTLDLTLGTQLRAAERRAVAAAAERYGKFLEMAVEVQTRAADG
jgi:Winged helix DNA-binding domain